MSVTCLLLLTDFLEDLQYLSEHYEDLVVRQMSGRIRELIVANGEVLLQNSSMESVPTGCATAWYGNCTALDHQHRALYRGWCGAAATHSQR